jgi:hypothetical protein
VEKSEEKSNTFRSFSKSVQFSKLPGYRAEDRSGGFGGGDSMEEKGKGGSQPAGVFDE